VQVAPMVRAANPWNRATSGQPKKKKIYTYTSEKKKNYIHKIKFLLEGKKNIQGQK
jgi:hypothetical protein